VRSARPGARVASAPLADAMGATGRNGGATVSSRLRVKTVPIIPHSRTLSRRRAAVRCSAPPKRRSALSRATSVQPTGARPSAWDARPPMTPGFQDRSYRLEIRRRSGARPRTAGSPAQGRRAGFPWRGSRTPRLRRLAFALGEQLRARRQPHTRAVHVRAIRREQSGLPLQFGHD
jgi:hypothetical protein